MRSREEPGRGDRGREDASTLRPTASVVHRPAMLLAGVSFHGDPFTSHAGWTEENEIGRLWRRLEVELGAAGVRVATAGTGPPSDGVRPTDPGRTYELHVRDQRSAETGEFEVFAGLEVATPDVPVVLSLKVVPAGEYAVFRLRGDQMLGDEPVVETWLARTGHEEAGPFVLLEYDERFLGVDRLEESELTLMIPVRATERDVER